MSRANENKLCTQKVVTFESKFSRRQKFRNARAKCSMEYPSHATFGEYLPHSSTPTPGHMPLSRKPVTRISNDEDYLHTSMSLDNDIDQELIDRFGDFDEASSNFTC